MTIYLKILLVVLPLVCFNFIAAVGTTYYFSRSALTDLASTLLDTRLNEAKSIAKEQLNILEVYGLEKIPASIAKAKIDAAKTISEIEVGRYGFLFAYNSKGLITAHPQKKMIGQKITTSDLYKKIQANTTEILIYDDGERHLARFATFSPWEWTIVATDPLHEVFHGIDTVKPYLLILWLAGSFITVIIVMTLFRHFIKPLNSLSLGVDRIGKGDLTTHIEVHTNDEFGKLTTTFNTMTSQLLKNREEMERKVLERTDDLNSANLQLQKSIEEKKETAKALQYNEQRMKAILEASPIGIALLIKRKVNWVNETLCNILRYTSSDILDKNTAFLYESTKEYERVGQYLYGKISQATIGEVETVWIKKDRSLADCKLRAYPLDPKNLDLGVIIAVTDITESKILANKLQQARKLEAIGTLAGGVAHDLNNILSGIVSYPELLMLDLPADSPLQKPLATIKKSGERASTIVQDLLTMARRGVAETEIVNVNTLIEEQLSGPEFAQLTSFHPAVRFTLNLEETLHYIMGSPAHLAKSIMNLLSNAAEAMPSGGEVTITSQNIVIDSTRRGYETIKPGEYVAVTITDGGIGISSEDLERIFEPFYTKKKMGRSGTGLGMAVVWGTIKDHDGYIDIDSSLNKGATFTLYLPATREVPSDKTSSFTLDFYKGTGEHILVVDDSPVQREIAESLLLKLGYHVACLASGEEAVEFMQNHPVDLIMLDMIMDPGIDGLETYLKIARLRSNIKIIVVSGYSETDRVKEVLRQSGGQYLKKPYSIEKIGIAIQEELARM